MLHYLKLIFLIMIMAGSNKSKIIVFINAFEFLINLQKDMNPLFKPTTDITLKIIHKISEK